MTKFLPLPLGKRDQPKDAIAATALTQTAKSIVLAVGPIKTKTAMVEFWNSVSDYATRNIAELSGARSNGAAKPKASAAAANGTGDKPAAKRSRTSKQRKPAEMQAGKAAGATA